MSQHHAEWVLRYPAVFVADVWYEALAVVLAERSPA